MRMQKPCFYGGEGGVLRYNDNRNMQFGEIRETTRSNEMSCGGIMTGVACTLQVECECVAFCIEFTGERRKRRMSDEIITCYGMQQMRRDTSTIM